MVKDKQKAYGKSIPKAAHVEFSLTPRAQEIWDAIPGDFQISFLIHWARQETGLYADTGTLCGFTGGWFWF